MTISFSKFRCPHCNTAGEYNDNMISDATVPCPRCDHEMELVGCGIRQTVNPKEMYCE